MGSSPYTLPGPDVRPPAVRVPKPLMTYAISVFLGVMFLLQLAFGRGDSELPLGRMGGVNGVWIRQGQIWELFTAAFLHGGVVHIGMNVFALISIGALLEILIGPSRLLLAFLVAALAGNVFAAIPVESRITIGASGGLWGLMTLLAVLVLRRSTLVPPRLAENLRPRMIRALVINAGVSFIPGVSWLAHLGGGLAGALLGLSGLLERGARPFPMKQSSPPALLASTGALVVLALLATGAGLLAGRPWELALPAQYHHAVVGEIALDVPIELRSRADDTVADDTHETVFGDIQRDGVLVEVTAKTFAAPPSDVDAVIDAWKKRNRPMEGFTIDSVERVSDPRPALRTHGVAPSGASYTEYSTFVGHDEVTLVVYRRNATEPWPDLETRTVQSLQHR
jgi:rhomboid protease GluP